ncbi:MAG: DUF4150 domain-containing protein [Nitrospirae bacterium]|nr:DUF4150 domain-containing protein [Nitrospirota bacterium]
MPSTVTVNNMTVVHKTSNGISMAFPDVCKTPAPPSPSPVPIPYPNIAMSSDAADTVSSVKADGNPIVVNTSKYSMSTGDEAGTLNGIMSNRIKGSANPQMWSMDVKADGKNVFRQLDIMLQNGGSKPTNTPPAPNLQPPMVGFAKGQDPEKWKIVEIRWSDAKLKCGGVVKIRTKTEDYPDGIPIAHIIHKTDSKKIHAFTKGKVNGDSVDIDWMTLNGPWEKAHKKLKVKAHGGKGVKESSNELEIEIPAEHDERVYVPANLNRAEVLDQVEVPSLTIFGITLTTKKVIQGSGRFVAGEYGYNLSINRGVFQIHCKMKLNIKHGVKLSGTKLRRAKKRWKKEIESTWDKKWKEHRIGCQRGDKCNCAGGCCLFPIRVKCSFVSGGEHVNVNLWPGAPTGTASGANPQWWDNANWYETTSGAEGNGTVVHAHEFGHSIGMEDEYVGGSTIADFYDVPGSLMQSGTMIMKQHWDRHPASGKSIHQRFLDAVKDNYKLLDI